MEGQGENKKKITVTTVVLIAVIVALVAMIVGGVIGFSLRRTNENKPVQVNNTVSNTSANTTNTASLNTTSNTTDEGNSTTSSTTASSTVNTSSWKTYSNQKYNIHFKYPAEATIKEDDFTNDPTFEDFCVTVNYKVTYVSIQTKATNLCHRTGIAYEGVKRNETLTLSDKQYQAKGYEEQGPGDTIDVHDETLSFTGPRGLEVEYGTHDPNISSEPSQYTFTGDYQKARPTMIAILQTIQ